MDVLYSYDGSLPGFLCCVFDSYLYHETPADIQSAGALEPTLFSVRQVTTDEDHARRVQTKLSALSPLAWELTWKGFLTCADRRELMLYTFIRALLREGPSLLRRLTADEILPLYKAVQHLESEAHLLKGFVRFSDLGGVLTGEIQPKNRVLPLLRPHFCARCGPEPFLLYDRTHREALLSQGGKWCITPLEDFTMAAPDETEARFRRLWKRFYDTIAIEARYNPKTRRTHMPMRYWGTMTEFQDEDFFTPAPQTPGGAGPGPAAPGGIPAPGTPTKSGRSGPGSAP